jgi:sugar lactone lactonase YvrE
MLSYFKSGPALTLATAVLLITAACDNKAKEEPKAASYKVETFVPGSPFHGLHGMTFGPDGTLYVGSVVGQAIYTVDTESGEVAEFIGPVEGQADDLEFNASGGLAWTAIGQGKVYYQTASGERRVIAEGLPGANSIAFNAEGRLFVTTVFMADALYEVHLSGKTPPRQIMEGMGGLNGFDFGPDGKLYGPIWFKGQIARVDVDAGTLEVISEGMTVPAAVNFDSKGVLHAIDNETGEIFRVNIETGERTLLATAPTNLDNLAFDADDRLFVSNMSDAAIFEVNRETGELRTVVSGPLTVPAGIAWNNGTLYVADTFNFSKVDTATGEVGDISRLISDHEYPTGVTANDRRTIIASANSGLIQFYDPQTEKRTARWEGFVIPSGVVDLPTGEVAVLEGIGRITLASGEHGQTRKTLIEGLVDPAGLGWADGTFYVSEGAPGTVSKVDGTTGEKTLVADGLAGPEGIALTADGDILVAEVGKDQLISIAPDGTISVIATDLKMGLVGYPPFPPSYIPSGVAIGGDGEIYVSSDVENSIYRITKE